MSLTDTSDKRLAAAAKWVNDTHDELAAARCELFASLEARRARPGRQAGQCGTPAGYRRHQRYREARCLACTEAWNWDQNRRRLAAA